MKRLEFFHWTLTVDGWGRKCKPHRSPHMMTEEEAKKRDPDATPDLQSREVRNCPETPAEFEAIQAANAYKRRD